MNKFDLSVKMFYGKNVTRNQTWDDAGIKEGFIDRMDDEIETIKRRRSSDDFKLQYGNTFAAKQHLDFDKETPPSPPVSDVNCPPGQRDVNAAQSGDGKELGDEKG